jgi:hypothetical protein
MKWNEIRQEYPSKWLKLKILKSHESDGKEFIDDMDVIKTIETDDEATDMLVNCLENEIVFHTSNEVIFSEIKNIFFSYRS